MKSEDGLDSLIDQLRALERIPGKSRRALWIDRALFVSTIALLIWILIR